MKHTNQIIRITPATMQDLLCVLHTTWTMLEEPEGWTEEDQTDLSENISSLIATLNEEGYA